MFLLMFYQYAFCLNTKLFYESFTIEDFITSDVWILANNNGIYSVCDSTRILGGYSTFGYQTTAMLYLQLPPHYSVEIKFNLWIIKNWNNEQFLAYVDQNLQFHQQYLNSIFPSRLCGVSIKVLVENISIPITHNANSIVIFLTSDLPFFPLNKFWGINQFKIYLNLCPLGCQICQSSDQIYDCISWLIIDSSLLPSLTANFNIDGWQIANGYQETSLCENFWILGGYGKTGKDSIIAKTINLPPHNMLNIKFRFIFLDSWDGEYIYFSINGDLYQQSDPCYFNDQEKTNLCGDSQAEKFWDFQITIPHTDNQVQVSFTCGLDEDFFNESFGIMEFQVFIQIQSFCGNGILENNEQCDDGNLIPFDGCSGCQFTCCDKCSLCIQTICQECYEGWILNQVNNQCMLQFEEIINVQICTNKCLKCEFGLCIECYQGWQTFNNDCIPICGDGIVVGDEECDDMNLIQYDGCNQCYYQCQKDCQQCIQGQCYDECKDGFYLINNKCITICGDGIIAGEEQCDNDQQYNCQQCQLQCSDNCNICQNGKCLECFYGYQLFNNLNECQTVCGNGLVTKDEECDDGNQSNFDGCSSQCKLEKNYLCKHLNYSFSQCSYSNQPYFEALYLKEQNQIQYIQLKFSQQVKLLENSNFTKFINISIENIDSQFYIYQIQVIQEATLKLNDVIYVIELNFLTNYNFIPYLQIQLLKPLVNQHNQELINYITKIKLQKPQYMNEQMQNTADILKLTSENLIRSLGSLAFLAFLVGNISLFKNIIEMLQQQSYLRFINIQFPQNLFIYFESSNLISIELFLSNLKLNNLFFKFVYFDYYIQSYHKFYYYDINADLFYNLQSQISQILILLITYYISILIIKIVQSLKIKQFEKIGNFLSIKLLKLESICQDYIFEFRKDKFQTYLETNFWILLFSSLLQIATSYYNKEIDLQNNFYYFKLALSYILLYFLILLTYLQVHKYSYLKYNFNQYWQSKSQLFCQLKKIIFLVILILFQNNEIIQSILLSLITLIYLIYLIKFQSNLNKLESINIIISEFMIFLFIFNVGLYWNQMDQIFNQDQQIIFGWIHIGMLLFPLFITLIISIIQFFKLFYKMILNKFHSQKSKNCDPYPMRNMITLKQTIQK